MNRIKIIDYIKNKKKEGRVAEVPTPDESVGEEIQKEKQRMLVQDINEYNRIKKHLKTYLIYKKAQNEKAIQEITDNRDTWANKTPSEYSDIVLQEIYRKNNNNIDINFIKFKIKLHLLQFFMEFFVHFSVEYGIYFKCPQKKTPFHWNSVLHQNLRRLRILPQCTDRQFPARQTSRPTAE